MSTLAEILQAISSENRWSMYPSSQSAEVTSGVISGVFTALYATFIQTDFVRQAFQALFPPPKYTVSVITEHKHKACLDLLCVP